MPIPFFRIGNQISKKFPPNMTIPYPTFTDEKILERDRFEFPAKTIFANNSKIIDWRAIYNVSCCSKKENRPKDTKNIKL